MLYLASRSPRRKTLLSRLTTDFELIEAAVQEVCLQGEDPQDYVLRMAMDKADAAMKKIHDHIPVLAADTEVVLDGKIIGKPRDSHEALDMLRRLSGVTHEVLTAVVVSGRESYSVINKNRITFRETTEQECRWYCQHFSPLDKAGAYGIQDAAASFVDRLEGSYSGVMGLPLHDTRELLIKAGVKLEQVIRH